MGRRAPLWLVPAVLLAGSWAGIYALYTAANPSPEAQARELLEAQMFDPGAMQLRNVRRVANGGLCGEVNGRNAFGGYVGFRRFYIVGSFVAIEGEGARPGAVAEQCG